MHRGTPVMLLQFFLQGLAADFGQGPTQCDTRACHAREMGGLDAGADSAASSVIRYHQYRLRRIWPGDMPMPRLLLELVVVVLASSANASSPVQVGPAAAPHVWEWAPGSWVTRSMLGLQSLGEGLVVSGWRYHCLHQK
jgi:hypothetical protein